MGKEIQVGSLVSVIDDNIKGKVILIEGNRITLEDEDGFERFFSEEELIVYDDKLAEDKTTVTQMKIKTEIRKVPKIVSSFVVDLHINNSSIPSNQILENQIKEFYRQLNEAIRKRKTGITFIHGKGEGILKHSIEKILKRNHIQYGEAPYPQYGYGALEVYLKGVNKLLQPRK